MKPNPPEIELFTSNARILFQGDSITDGNRGRTDDPNHILGHGYVFIIAAKYGAAFPDRKLTFHNRGISGHKVADLLARWDVDTIELKPDILSLLIGINDLNRGVSSEDFKSQYDLLILQTLEKLPDVKLILAEPFAVPGSRLSMPWEAFSRELQQRQAIVAELADRYGTILVKYQQVFDVAIQRAPAEHWIWDGIHPTYAGHQIMADEWVKAVIDSKIE